MVESINNLDSVAMQEAYVVTRESPSAPVSTREYRTSAKTWSNKIEDAKVYEDIELANNMRNLVAKNTTNFLKVNGFAIPTRFAHQKLSEAMDQLSKGDQNVTVRTQGLAPITYESQRTHSGFKYTRYRD
jgi:hypothetical protein